MARERSPGGSGRGGEFLAGELHRAVVVAVVAVGVVEAAVDEVVDVVAVGHRFMSAAGTVVVPFATGVARGNAPVGVALGHFEGVLFHRAVGILVVEVAVVEVVEVIAVLDRGMAAAGAVTMVVVFVLVDGIHGNGSGWAAGEDCGKPIRRFGQNGQRKWQAVRGSAAAWGRFQRVSTVNGGSGQAWMCFSPRPFLTP